MTVVMKIDLVGPERRGFALGPQRGGRLRRRRARRRGSAAGWRRSTRPRRARRRPAPAIAVDRPGSQRAVRPRHRRARRARAGRATPDADERAAVAAARRSPTRRWREPALRACSQAGLVNNLNDALAWGLVPLFLAAHGASVGEIGLVAGLYPAVWGARRRSGPATGPTASGASCRSSPACCCRPRALAVLGASDGAVGRSPPSAAVAARRRHRARLPDADRRDLRRGLPRRPRAGRRRLPLLARHGLRRRRPDRRRRRRRARLRRRDRRRRRPHRGIRAVGRGRPARPPRLSHAQADERAQRCNGVTRPATSRPPSPRSSIWTASACSRSAAAPAG